MKTAARWAVAAVVVLVAAAVVWYLTDRGRRPDEGGPLDHVPLREWKTVNREDRLQAVTRWISGVLKAKGKTISDADPAHWARDTDAILLEMDPDGRPVRAVVEAIADAAFEVRGG